MLLQTADVFDIGEVNKKKSKEYLNFKLLNTHISKVIFCFCYSSIQNLLSTIFSTLTLRTIGFIVMFKHKIIYRIFDKIILYIIY